MKSLVSFPLYEEYKESGIDWIREIPRDWLIKPGFTVFSENKRSNKGMVESRVLSLSYGRIVIRPPERLVGLVPESFETYQLVEPNDIIVRCTDLQNDQTSLRIGFSENYGIITSAYLNLKVSPLFNAKYYYYYLHSLDITKVLYKLGSGLRQNLSFIDFKRLAVFDFSYEKQKLIATYLDQKTTQIDQAIEIKKKQIELLKERQQVIIQQAVTKGLDPSVKMKDSGVEWIGEVPEHWEVLRLKFLVKNLESGVSVNASEVESAIDDEIGILKTSAVYNYFFDSSENKKVFESELKRVACDVKEGSIIISRMNAPGLVGASGYVEKSYPNLFLPDRLWQMRFIKSDKNIAIFISKVLVSRRFRGVVESIATGSSPSMKNIAQGDLLNLEVPYPPLKEIISIISFIEKAAARSEQAIALQLQQIKKLQEYKSSLINSAVTGKIKITPDMVASEE